MLTTDVRLDYLAVVVAMAEAHYERCIAGNDAQLEAIRDMCRVLGRWSEIDG